MARTALYRDPVPFRPARADVQVDLDALLVRMPDGGRRRYALDGCMGSTVDGCVVVMLHAGRQRRFVRMLILERAGERAAVITPPDLGAVAPGVVRLPEAPLEAAIVELRTWDAISEYVMSGGRLGACSIAELARLAQIATPQFAVLLGEIVAQRALELVAMATRPVRGEIDLESALQPLVDAAKESPQAGEALVSALAHAALPVRWRWPGS
jgi:hypothetical protein